MFSTNKDNKAFEVFPKHLGAKLVVTKKSIVVIIIILLFFSRVFFMPQNHFLDHAAHEPSPFLYILMKKVFSLPPGDRQLEFCANPVRFLFPCENVATCGKSQHFHKEIPNWISTKPQLSVPRWQRESL